MAAPSPQDKVKDKGYINWLKVTLGLYYMKSALHPFIENEVNCLRQCLLNKIYGGQRVPLQPCTMCDATCVKRNKITGIWAFQRQCGSYCDVWLDELLKLHANPKSEKIYWDNSQVPLWPFRSWEFVKVFMPRGQLPSNTGPAECDVQSLMTLLSNCKHFHSSLSPQGLILTRTISAIRNKIMHDGEMKVSDADRNSFIQQIIQFLEDPVSLVSLEDCKAAVDTIRKIQNDSMDVFFNGNLQIMALKTAVNEIRQEQGVQEKTTLDSVDSLKKEYRQLTTKLEAVETRMDIVERVVKTQSDTYEQRFTALEEKLKILQITQRTGENNSCRKEFAADHSILSYRNPGPWSTSDHIRSPEYQHLSIRLSTFAHWPCDIKQNIKQMAAAGFYYTGLQDLVRCFACDGGLQEWDREDDPWIEHARWFPACPFLKRVKGQEFINLVRKMTEDSEEEDVVVHSTFKPNNPKAEAPVLRNKLTLLTDGISESGVLENDAARTILDFGFSRAAVANAINELRTKGKADYRVQDILEMIFQMEENCQLDKEHDGHAEPQPRPSNPVNCKADYRVQDILEMIFQMEENCQLDKEHDGHAEPQPRPSNPVNCLVGSLQQERLRQKMLCIDCRQAKRDILFLPCTHLCLCSTCAERSKICPLCYKLIREKIKTFI